MGTKAALKSILARIILDFEISQAAYGDYCSGGKTLFFAKILRTINHRLNSNLQDLSEHLNAQQIHDIAPLVYHIEAWTQTWDHHYSVLTEAQKNNLETTFIFESRVRFPSDSKKILEALFKAISQKNAK